MVKLDLDVLYETKTSKNIEQENIDEAKNDEYSYLSDEDADEINKQLQEQGIEINKPIVKTKRKIDFKFIAIVLSLLIAICISIAVGLHFNKKAKENSSQDNPTTINNENNNPKEKLANELESSTKQVNIPTKVSIEDLYGGYILGITTYYPDDPKKLYIDFVIQSPKEKQQQATDETAQKILKTLKSTLPVINDTIEVKNKDKVTMEIYKKDDNYQTILLYEGKPFGYIATDKNLVSTNHVTSEYVTNVAK